MKINGPLTLFAVAAFGLGNGSNLQAQPGTKMWSYTTGAEILSSPALASAKTIYVGSYDQFLYAINAGDGSLRWKFSVQPTKPGEAAYIYSSPAVGPDGSIYFGTDHENLASGASTGQLYALRPDGT